MAKRIDDVQSDGLVADILANKDVPICAWESVQKAHEGDEDVDLVAEMPMLVIAQVELKIGNDSKHDGHVVVTNKRVVWVGGDVGLELKYPQINMHAICRDDQVTASPCLYCQVVGEEEEDEDFQEWILVPKTLEEVDELFQVMSRGASLFPATDDDEDENGEENFFFHGEGEQQECDADVGFNEEELVAKWGKLFSQLEEPSSVPGQFDDAEDVPEHMKFVQEEPQL